MTCRDINHYLNVIRKGYKKIPALLGLFSAVLIIFGVLFAFILLLFEPANNWHNTTFTLSHFEYRYTRGGGVLDLYTTDGRCFVLNHNDEEIRYQLKEGQQYDAVYSDDFFHDIIKGLKDADQEYMNDGEMRKSDETERFWIRSLLILCSLLLLTMNAIYAILCIREEKKRIQKRQRKRK